MQNDYFNLQPTALTKSPSQIGLSAFTIETNSSGDRADSDFDQRQNLVFFSIVDVPAWLQSRKAGILFRDWKFSQLAAFRSGVPYTIFAPNQGIILNERANEVNPAVAIPTGNTDVAGGVRLLNPAAFAIPALGQIGNTGRNEFRGPGFYNIDVSLSRSFPVRRLGEAGRLTLRADAFNFLNHANLNLPDVSITDRAFGVAQYGRAQASSGLGADPLSGQRYVAADPDDPAR